MAIPSPSTALIRDIAARLEPVSLELSVREAEQVLLHVLGLERRSALYAGREIHVTARAHREILSVVDTRLTGSPLAHCLGAAYFFNRTFTVTPDTLIPRPDTETLVSRVLERERGASPRFLDIATGCGCIAGALLRARPGWNAVATDICPRALAVARGNLGSGTPLVCADLLAALRRRPFFDFIVCNPPYVSTAEMAELDKSVRAHEPEIALHGGADGLEIFRFLAARAAGVLVAGGRIYCEIGATQAASVTELFVSHGWHDVQVHADLAGRDRVVTATSLPC